MNSPEIKQGQGFIETENENPVQKEIEKQSCEGCELWSIFFFFFSKLKEGQVMSHGLFCPCGFKKPSY